jgi:hypothetical protein
LGDVICFNYIAFHILDVEHLENFNGTKRIGRAARREHFELLDVSPGPNRTSSDNLATPGSPMLTPSLVRTMVQRDTHLTLWEICKSYDMPTDRDLEGLL